MKHSISLVILFLFPFILSAQSTIFSEKKETFIDFSYISSPNAQQTHQNSIIRQLAFAQNKPTNKTLFRLAFKMKLELSSNTDQKLNGKIIFSDPQLSGDVYYNGIYMDDALFPSDIGFSVVVSNTDGDKLKTFTYEKLGFNNNRKIKCVFDFTDSIGGSNYSLDVFDIKASFTKEDRKKFKKKTSLVDDYYASIKIIEENIMKIQAIDLENIDMIPVYDVEADAIERSVEELRALDFPNRLHLHKNDPAKFIVLFADMQKQLRKTRDALNKQLVILDQLFYDKGSNFLYQGNEAEAIKYFTKSLLVNPFFSPSHYQIAKIDYQNKDYALCADRIRDVLQKMNPDPITHNNFITLADELYNTYLREANDFILNNNYEEAIGLLNEAKRFCSSTPGILCTEELTQAFSRAKFGMYRSYLSVAKRAITTDKLELAYTYVDQATTFQKQNKDDIINNAEADALIIEIVNAYATHASRLNANGNYQAGLNFCDKADAILVNYPGLKCPELLKREKSIARKGVFTQYVRQAYTLMQNDKLDEAEGKLKQAYAYQANHISEIPDAHSADTVLNQVKWRRYNKHVDEGSHYLSYEHYQSSLDAFNKAKILEDDYIFPQNSKLDSMRRAAAKPVLLEKAREGNVKAWGNYLEEARKIFVDINKDAETYGMDKDPDILAALEKLSKKIFSRECQNAQSSYDKSMKQARNSIKHEEFLTAINQLNEAINISNANNDCFISTDEAEKLLKQFEKPGTYQKFIMQADQAFLNGDYSRVIPAFKTAEAYYQVNNLMSFGMVTPDMFQYISSKNNNTFLSYCCNYYVENNEADKAFDILKLLKIRNYPLNYARSLQTKLGIQMAIRDRAEKGHSNPKGNILAYTNGDRWFKYFKKAYLKSWKKSR